MKYLLITIICLSAWSVDGKDYLTDQHIEMQRIVLKDQLSEGHILPMDFERKMYALKLKASAEQRSQGDQKVFNRGPGGTASISGTVRLGLVGEFDVAVQLRSYPSGDYISQTWTDASGDYSFPNLAAGDYYVTVQDYYDSYLNVMWSAFGTENCNSWCQADFDNEINLADAVSFVDVDIDVEVGGTVSGNVTSGGSPIDGLYVTVIESDYNYSVGVPTNAGGDFMASGLPAGDYFVVVQNYDDLYIDAIWSTIGTEICINCQPDVDNLFNVALGATQPGIDLSLTVGATLTGRISDATTAAAVETLQVSLYDPTATFYGNFFTVFDGSGNYTLNGIPQGNYKIYLEPDINVVNEYVPEIYNNIPCNLCGTMLLNGAGDVVALTNGATTSGIDFALNKGASISGAILNETHLPETLQEFALIYVFNASNRLIATQFLSGTNNDPLFNGAYKIGGLLPGTYFVQGGDLGREFFQRELYNDVRCPWSGCDRGGGGTAVVLGASEQRLGINFLLEYGGKISGTVTDALSGLPINSTGNEYVQFYDSSGQVAGGAAIRPDGTYTAQRALPPGTYSVRTGSMFTGTFSPPYVMQKYDATGNIDCPGVTCDLTAGNVVVPAYTRLSPRDPVQEAINATVTGIDFALSPAFSFSGTITELGSANPIADVHVLVFDDSGNFANWATTDAVGGFTVSGLPAGTYYAITNNGSNLPFMGFFPQEVGGWIDILFDGTPCPGSACDVTTGTPIVLGGSPVINGSTEPVLDFGLLAGGTITGQVNTFGSQLPASYVDVNVFNDQGAFYGSYPADENGFYLTVGLPEGSYYLTTSNNGALVNAKYGGDYCFEGSCDPLDATPVVISGNQSITGVDFNLRPDYLFKNSVD